VNQRKADRLPHEAGLKLLTLPRAPKELPVTSHLRNAHGVATWKLFLKGWNHGGERASKLALPFRNK
jgi:hypothetical protein